jgi:hypothetical protein
MDTDMDLTMDTDTVMDMDTDTDTDTDRKWNGHRLGHGLGNENRHIYGTQL